MAVEKVESYNLTRKFKLNNKNKPVEREKMRKLKTLLMVLISGVIIIGISSQFTYSQNNVKKVKPTEPNVKNSKKSGKVEVTKPIPKVKPTRPDAKSIKKLSKSEVDKLISNNNPKNPAL